MRYKLHYDADFTYIAREAFAKDKFFRILICPFSEEGDFGASRCGDWCPHFEIEEPLDGRLRVTISCTPCRKLIAIDGDLPNGSKV